MLKKYLFTLSLLFVSFVPVSASITTDIHAAYDMNEVSGNAIDATGQGGDLINGDSITYTAGYIDKSANFVAYSGNGLYDSSSSFTSGTARTWGGMFKISSSASGDRYLFDDTTDNTQERFILYYNGTTLHMFANGNEVTGTFSYNTWINIVVTRSSGGAYTLYIDGVSQGSANKGGLTYVSNEFTVGCSYAGGSCGYFDVDDVTIWDKALTSTEVTEFIDALDAGLEYPFVSGGGGSPPVVYPVNVTNIVPANLVSSLLFTYPTIATTTYSFTSSYQLASSTKQSGLVYIVHTSTTTPTITWGGVSMTNLLDSAVNGNYITSLFSVHNPVSGGAVIISGLVASSTVYISESIWDNATNFTAVDTYKTVFGSDIASIELPSPVAPITLVSSFFTPADIGSFNVLSNSSLVQFATSTTDFSLVKSSCTSALDTCAIGYNHPYSFISTAVGSLVGIGMYATTTVITSSSTLSLDFITGGLGTDKGFNACFIDLSFTASLICTGKNMVFWVLSLFVPSSSDVVDIKDTLTSVITASSSLTTSILLIPLQLALWTSSSSAPTSTALSIQIPKASGSGYYTGSFSGNASSNSVFQSIDYNLYLFFLWIFGIFTLLYTGVLFIKLIH